MGMIKTQREYEQTQRTLQQWRASGERLRASIEASGLSPDLVEQAMAGHMAMQDQMAGELASRPGQVRPLCCVLLHRPANPPAGAEHEAEQEGGAEHQQDRHEGYVGARPCP